MFHVIMTSGVVITLREGFKILEGKTIIIKMLHFKYYYFYYTGPKIL